MQEPGFSWQRWPAETHNLTVTLMGRVEVTEAFLLLLHLLFSCLGLSSSPRGLDVSPDICIFRECPPSLRWLLFNDHGTV